MHNMNAHAIIVTTNVFNDFTIPSNAVSRLRVYVWLEGQDIDSLETDSEGAKISISLDFSKDTYGYNSYDE